MAGIRGNAFSEKGWVTTALAAKRLNTSQRTLAGWKKSKCPYGTLTPCRVNGRIVYKAEEVEACRQEWSRMEAH